MTIKGIGSFLKLNKNISLVLVDSLKDYCYDKEIISKEYQQHTKKKEENYKILTKKSNENKNSKFNFRQELFIMMKDKLKEICKEYDCLIIVTYNSNIQINIKDYTSEKNLMDHIFQGFINSLPSINSFRIINSKSFPFFNQLCKLLGISLDSDTYSIIIRNDSIGKIVYIAIKDYSNSLFNPKIMFINKNYTINENTN